MSAPTMTEERLVAIEARAKAATTGEAALAEFNASAWLDVTALAAEVRRLEALVSEGFITLNGTIDFVAIASDPGKSCVVLLGDLALNDSPLRLDDAKALARRIRAEIRRCAKGDEPTRRRALPEGWSIQ